VTSNILDSIGSRIHHLFSSNKKEKKEYTSFFKSKKE
jgi:hypothetical protein